MIFHQPHNSLGNFNYNLRFYTEESWNFHFHRNLELVCVQQGAVECTVNNTVHTLRAGDYGICLPCDIHAYHPLPDSRYWVLVFSEDFVRQFAKSIQGKTADGFAFSCTPAVRQLLTEALLQETEPSVWMMKACLYAVCGEFLRAVPLSESSGKQQIFLAITDYLSKNYASNITLNDVARLLGYNYNYVSRYFRKVFSMSFHDLLNLYRLEAATRLLEETDKKITEIAFESGFQSVRSFNNCFRTHLGLSPSEYKTTSRK